jgi:lysophospholipase L1-like esterase
VHGAEIKSAGPFRRNLEQLLALARERREPVLLASFAHVRPDSRPDTELWGAPEHVFAGLAAHNRILADLAQAHGARWLDLQARLAGDPAYFTDVCHFSAAGAQAFAEAAAEAVGPGWPSGTEIPVASQP